MLFTLASNGGTVWVNMDNIAFANTLEEKPDEESDPVVFTRLYMKSFAAASEDFPPWIDVKESVELMAFRKLNEKNEKANVDHTKTSVLFRILVMLFVESVICVILGYGGYLVYCRKFNAGQLVEFIGYFTAVVWPISTASHSIIIPQP